MAVYGLTEFLAEVEADIAWREQEARELARLIAQTPPGATRDALLRSHVVLLYAHAEGGVKVALTGYVRVINSLSLSVAECAPSVVAAAWDDLFHSLSDHARKHDFFRARMPDNTKLHRFARHVDFVARLRQIEALTVRLDHEVVVDTESNIDSMVLTKILFYLGFPPDVIGKKFDELQYLRGVRNAIAHGERRLVQDGQCAKYQGTVFALLTRLRDLLAKAIRQESFRRVA